MPPADKSALSGKPKTSRPAPTCTICGEEKSAGQIWFLVTEIGRPDRLKILHWNDDLAMRWGIHRACCPTHVQELVVHWMVNGRLDDLFAAVEAMALHGSISRAGFRILDEPDIRAAREIAELCINREIVQRALQENAESLNILLEELWDTLQLAMLPPARLESGTPFPNLRPV
jgi:hypothetical protein